MDPGCGVVVYHYIDAASDVMTVDVIVTYVCTNPLVFLHHLCVVSSGAKIAYLPIRDFDEGSFRHSDVQKFRKRTE